jgi:hypothetical protein
MFSGVSDLPGPLAVDQVGLHGLPMLVGEILIIETRRSGVRVDVLPSPVPAAFSRKGSPEDSAVMATAAKAEFS